MISESHSIFFDKRVTFSLSVHCSLSDLCRASVNRIVSCQRGVQLIGDLVWYKQILLRLLFALRSLLFLYSERSCFMVCVDTMFCMGIGVPVAKHGGKGSMFNCFGVVAVLFPALPVLFGVHYVLFQGVGRCHELGCSVRVSPSGKCCLFRRRTP